MAESTKNMTVGAGSASASVTATVSDQMPGVPCPATPGYTYTGMRYVPVFADPPEWSSANTYEPLEIVTHKGNSYTSKTFVPVGVDILDPQYWVLTGNYNAQVEQYRQDVANVKDKISIANANISKINTQIDEINTQIDEIETEIRDGIYLCLGDSWVSEGTIANIVAKQKNLTLINKAVSGASFTAFTSYVKTIAEEINEAVSQISDKSLVKLVTLVAGVNDVSHHGEINQSAINGAVAQALQSIRANFPNAEIVFAADAPYSTNFLSLSHYYYAVDQFQRLSYYHKVRFVNLYGMFNNSSYYKEDNLHPNVPGYGLVASMLLGGTNKQACNLAQTSSDDTIYLYFTDEIVYLNYYFAAGSRRSITLDRYFAFKIILNVNRVGGVVDLSSTKDAYAQYVDTITIPQSESKLYGFIIGTISPM